VLGLFQAYTLEPSDKVVDVLTLVGPVVCFELLGVRKEGITEVHGENRLAQLAKLQGRERPPSSIDKI
jgi:hypothetical protein